MMANTFVQRLKSLNTLLLGGFFLLLLCSSIALGAFAYLQNTIQSHTVYTNDTLGHCILYADSLSTVNGTKVELSRSGACSFAIWGEVTLAIYAAAALIIVIGRIHAAKNNKIAIGIMIIEVVLVVGFMLIAFLLGLIVASGLADTCNDLSYQSAGTSGTGCSRYVVPDEDSPVIFFHHIATSVVCIWLGFLDLLATLVIYMVMLVSQCCRRRTSQLRPWDDNDDPMLPL